MVWVYLDKSFVSAVPAPFRLPWLQASPVATLQHPLAQVTAIHVASAKYVSFISKLSTGYFIKDSKGSEVKKTWNSWNQYGPSQTLLCIKSCCLPHLWYCSFVSGYKMSLPAPSLSTILYKPYTESPQQRKHEPTEPRYKKQQNIYPIWTNPGCFIGIPTSGQ